MESGHRSDSGIFIHGTVVANTDSWVFFYTFLLNIKSKIPTYIECHGVIIRMYSWNLFNTCISGYIFIVLLRFSRRTYYVRTAKITIHFLHSYAQKSIENHLQ